MKFVTEDCRDREMVVAVRKGLDGVNVYIDGKIVAQISSVYRQFTMFRNNIENMGIKAIEGVGL